MNRPGSTVSDREFGERMAELDSEFGVTRFHDRWGEIVERYEVKR